MNTEGAEEWAVIAPNLALRREDVIGAYVRDPGVNTADAGPEVVIKMRSGEEFWTAKDFAQVTSLIAGNDPPGVWMGSEALLIRMSDMISCMRRAQGLHTKGAAPEVVIQMRNGHSFWSGAQFEGIVEAVTGRPMPAVPERAEGDEPG